MSSRDRFRDTARRVHGEIVALFAIDDDAVVRERFQDLLAQSRWAVVGFTHLWAPRFWRRPGLRFLVRSAAAETSIDADGNWKWPKDAWDLTELRAFVDDVEQSDEIELYRRMFGVWLAAQKDGALAWRTEVRAAFRAAPDRRARSRALERREQWYSLDEDSAVDVYALDPVAAAPFVLRHLETQRGSWWGGTKRADWTRLSAAARAAGDLDTAFAVYRAQVAPEVWRKDVLAVAESGLDATTLDAELQRRQPPHVGATLFTVMFEVLERAGDAAVPWAHPCARSLVSCGAT